MLKAFKWINFLFIGLFIFNSVIELTLNHESLQYEKSQKIDKYWLGNWVELIFILVFSRILLVKKKKNFVRILTGLLFIFNLFPLLILIKSQIWWNYATSVSIDSIFPLGNYFLLGIVLTSILFLIIMFIQDKIKTNDVRN